MDKINNTVSIAIRDGSTTIFEYEGIVAKDVAKLLHDFCSALSMQQPLGREFEQVLEKNKQNLYARW